MVGFPAFEVPEMPSHRLPSPFYEVPEELGGNGCQIMVDGLWQKCSLVTRNNVQGQFRNGDKIATVDPNQELPGTMLHFTFTWEETTINSGWTTEEDDNGNEVPVWSDYLGSSTTVHFTNITISSWDISAHGRGSQDAKRVVPLPENIRQLVTDRLNSKQPGKDISCDQFIAKVIAKASETSNADNRSIRNRAIANKQMSQPWVDVKPYANSPLEVLSKVSTFTVVEGLKSPGGSPIGGTVRGTILDRPEILINARYRYIPAAPGVDYIKGANEYYTTTIVHELSHLAGPGMTDGALAAAAYDLGLYKAARANPLATEDSEILKNSGHWSSALAQYCGW
jgi:hypothetical protein